MIAIVDNRIDSSSLLALENMGAELFLMPPATYLQKGVASHPDMLVFFGFGKLFCHERYYSANKPLIDAIAKKTGAQITLSSEDTGADYPRDVLFNAALVGNKLICNKKNVSKLVLSAAKESNCEILNVPQGYTKCSTCIVSDNAIITADKSIYAACLSQGIDALIISEGNVDLPSYSYGFIGGASGSYGDTVCFCGNPSLHPDGNAIISFCQHHGKQAISLSNEKLFDVGTIMIL